MERRRSPLAGQSLKVTVLNYILAVFTGCIVAAAGLSIWNAAMHATSPFAGLMEFGISALLFAIVALPFAFMGLAPVAVLTEILARKTPLSTLTITIIAVAASVPLALTIMPGTPSNSQSATAILFGILVTLAWALFSFWPNGASEILQPGRSSKNG